MTRKDIHKAAGIIKQGGIVAMPTETVYGLAGDATNDEAVAKIFEAKGRPQFNPLIVHVTDIAMASRFAEIPNALKTLAEAFWPGPLTLVAKRRPAAGLSHLVSAGLETIALRAPAHPMAQALIAAADRPLAAPSANRSGEISPTEPAHVKASLGDRVDMVLDGGRTAVGVESTIMRISDEGGALLLRPGGIPAEEIERCLGAPVKTPTADAAIQAPGMLASHYAPHASVRLDADKARTHEAFLGFGAAIDETAAAFFNLSDDGDLREAAANLFAALHQLDAICTKMKLTGIAVAPVPETGLGAAINDRLKRAAAPRG